MKNHISGPFLQLNAWISWAVLIALLAWQSLFCHHVLFANWEGNFPICSVRVSIIWSFQLTLLPDCLIVTEAIQHHIKLHFNLLNLGNRISFGKHRSWLTTARRSNLGVLQPYVIQTVWESDLKSHLLKGQVFTKSKGHVMNSPIHLPRRY